MAANTGLFALKRVIWGVSVDTASANIQVRQADQLPPGGNLVTPSSITEAPEPLICLTARPR